MTAADYHCRWTTPQGEKPLLQLTFIRPWQRFREVFGLKCNVCNELVFCHAVAQAAIAAAIFNNWHWKRASRCSPSSIIAIFHTISLLSLPQNKIRAGKLLIDSVHLQEERLGGRPHYCYRRACRHRPVVDRVLQKNIRIADDHG